MKSLFSIFLKSLYTSILIFLSVLGNIRWVSGLFKVLQYSECELRLELRSPDSFLGFVPLDWAIGFALWEQYRLRELYCYSLIAGDKSYKEAEHLLNEIMIKYVIKVIWGFHISEKLSLNIWQFCEIPGTKSRWEIANWLLSEDIKPLKHKTLGWCKYFCPWWIY